MCESNVKTMAPLYILTLVFIMKTTFVESGLVIPMRGPVLQNVNSYNNPVESEEIGSLLDRQIPDDIVYDLAGRMKLITRDEINDKYNTFMVYRDEHGIPYVRDPDTGHKYVVKHSRTKRDIEIYRITLDTSGKPVATDWATMTVNWIKLNSHGEVQLVPINDANLKFGDQDETNTV